MHTILIRLGILAFFLVIGNSAQRRNSPSLPPPPPLPPLRRPGPPLLPPVPSVDFIDRLTKAQLAFIRHHQEIQRNDKTNYSPYACLPKYICIVEDQDGSKRTAVVNGLHPVLRGSAPVKLNTHSPYHPGEDGPQAQARYDLPSASNSPPLDPETAYRNQLRLDHDEFLRDQERADEIAQSEWRRRRRLQELAAAASQISAEADSESDEEEASIESGESPKPTPSSFNFTSTTTTTSKTPTAVVQSSGTGNLINLNKFKYVIPLPSFSLFNQKRVNPPQADPSPSSFIHRILFRGKREIRARSSSPFLTKLGPGIRSTEQCRILYNGCDLDYDQIMQIADEGQVLIEGDDPPQKKGPSPPKRRVKPEDDEADQALKEAGGKPLSLPGSKKVQAQTQGQKVSYKKKPYKIRKNVKDSKYGDSKSPYNVQSKRPASEEAEEEDLSDEREKVAVASLPILPMRFQWGKPQVYVNGKPQTPAVFGVNGRKPTKPPTPPPPTTPTTTPPLFVAKPIYQKINRTLTDTNVVKINATHALQIKTQKSKPYRPTFAQVLDKNGNPVSFASVYTEIAGSSGGIHDYFDKIANNVGIKTRLKPKFAPRPPRPNSPPKKRNKDQKKKKAKKPAEKLDSEEEEKTGNDDLSEEEEENDYEQKTTKKSQPNPKSTEDDHDDQEDHEEDDAVDKSKEDEQDSEDSEEKKQAIFAIQNALSNLNSKSQSQRPHAKPQRGTTFSMFGMPIVIQG